jgi:hypothetical protein
MRLLMPASLLLLAGCSDYETTRVSRTDDFSQAPSNLVDILWVIDNSTSMTEELETASMEFHLGVISTDISDANLSSGVLLGSPNVLTSDCLADGITDDCTYAGTFETLVRRGTDGDDQEKGLEAAVRAVTPPLIDT